MLYGNLIVCACVQMNAGTGHGRYEWRGSQIIDACLLVYSVDSNRLHGLVWEVVFSFPPFA